MDIAGSRGPFPRSVVLGPHYSLYLLVLAVSPTGTCRHVPPGKCLAPPSLIDRRARAVTLIELAARGCQKKNMGGGSGSGSTPLAA